jgi:type VI secretion system protein ImpG
LEDLEPFYDYYSRELTYLRHQGAQFAKKYPQVAQRLDFTLQESSDPHVERLLESFAYLTARLQRDIDDQFPRLTNALLSILYPQFVCCVPSLSIAEFVLSPDKGKLSDLYAIPKGTPLFINTNESETCRFQTCYDIVLGPYELVSAEIITPSSHLSCASMLASPRALKLCLRSFGEGFKRMNLKSLRFFLEGSRLFKNSMYEGLFAQETKIVALLGDPEAPDAVYELPSGSLSQVGFKPHESVIPYPGHAHPGYRLMFEYFHFPEKFYFFDIENIFLPQEARMLTFFISLSDAFTFKATDITAQHFRLHCSPVVNLFSKISEPVRLNHRVHEYRLIADLKHEKTTEIHSISEVKATVDGSSRLETFDPYFSYSHQTSREKSAFWISRRMPSLNPDFGGTDVFLSFIDQHMDPHLPPAHTAFAHILCTNRFLAHEIPVEALLEPERENPAARIVCLYRPTLQYYPTSEGTSQWRLISQLGLNHLSLSNDHTSLLALKEIVHLYADAQASGSLPELDAILKMETSSVMRRFGLDAWRGFIAGTRIRLTVDPERNTQKDLFLFASVLNHFFSLFAGINSFTELELYNQNSNEVWKTWHPIAGSKPLL